MLDQALRFIAGELGGYLERSFPRHTDLVRLASPQDPDGGISQEAIDKLLLCVVAMEPDVSGGRQPVSVQRGTDKTAQRVAAKLNINLTLLLAASFNNYAQGLRFLSASLAFLHTRSPFTPGRSADFPKGVSKLDLQPINLSLQDLSSLWGVMGGRLLPSMAYQLRMISIDTDYLIGQLPDVSTPETGLST